MKFAVLLPVALCVAIAVISLKGFASFSVGATCLLSNCQPDGQTPKAQNPAPPIACSLNVLSKEERERHAALRRQLHDAVQEVTELPDGYGFRFLPDAQTLVAVAEFISYERRCCPFFKFELEIAGDKEPLWLRLRGGDGVKEFLRTEFLNREK